MHPARLAAGLAALSALSLPALAGGPTETAVEAPVAAAAPKAADPWSGPWASVTLGSGRSTYDISASAPQVFVVDPIIVDPPPVGPPTGTGPVIGPGPVGLGSIGLDLPDFGGQGGTAGAELGYDHRLGDKLIVGVQVGRSTAAIDTDAALNLVPLLPVDLTYSYGVANTTSVLGRVGYLVNDRSMIFALAGMTRAEFEGNLAINGGGTSYGIALEGVTLGAGIETLMSDKISLRLDYRVTRFDDYTLLQGPIGPTVGTVDLESSLQTVNAAVVMRF